MSSSKPQQTARSAPAQDTAVAGALANRDVDGESLLAALPHPILVIGKDNRITFANAAAEAFFSMGEAMLKRAKISEVVAFGCPLLSLVEQIQQAGSDCKRIRHRGRHAALFRAQARRRLWRPDAGGPSPHVPDAATAQHGADDRAAVDASCSRPFGVGHGGRTGARDQEPAVGHSRCGAIARAGPVG